MSTKAIVVLANSVKHHPGRCVAGREVKKNQAGNWELGGWVRPISTIGEGELNPTHLKVAGGGELAPFEIVEVRLLKAGSDKTQPENWYIDASVPWQKLATWPKARLNDLVEQPANLWYEPSGKSDRVSAAFLTANPPAQSLFVLNLKATLVRDDKKLRLRFAYKGRDYNLSVTDPNARLFMHNNCGGSSELELDGASVCVSLTPLFNGYHYKVVATLL